MPNISFNTPVTVLTVPDHFTPDTWRAYIQGESDRIYLYASLPPMDMDGPGLVCEKLKGVIIAISFTGVFHECFPDKDLWKTRRYKALLRNRWILPRPLALKEILSSITLKTHKTPHSLDLTSETNEFDSLLTQTASDLKENTTQKARFNEFIIRLAISVNLLQLGDISSPISVPVIPELPTPPPTTVRPLIQNTPVSSNEICFEMSNPVQSQNHCSEESTSSVRTTSVPRTVSATTVESICQVQPEISQQGPPSLEIFEESMSAVPVATVTLPILAPMIAESLTDISRRIVSDLSRLIQTINENLGSKLQALQV
jgi:hypothetical protein